MNDQRWMNEIEFLREIAPMNGGLVLIDAARAGHEKMRRVETLEEWPQTGCASITLIDVRVA